MAKEKVEEKKINKDVLEAYPERLQVDAFPERRYVRLTRFLAIFTIVNLACVIAGAGGYFYMARNRDIKITAPGWVHLYSIDPERKLLLPSEPFEANVSAMQLVIEKNLRQYLEERYTHIWDMDTVRKRWEKGGFIDIHSTPSVFQKFTADVAQSLDFLRNNNQLIRDVHIYSLYPVHGDLWSAYIETFDFPLEETLGKKCDCVDNSSKCLNCKEKNAVNRERKKILIRVNFFDKKSLENPLGLLVYAYYTAYVSIPKDKEKAEKFWDLPPALRPDI